LLPDDFDPFAAPLPASVAQPSAASGGAGAFDDLIPSAVPASIDQLFGLRPGERDPLADFMADLTPPRGAGSDARSRAAPLSTDPMALFGAAPGAPDPAHGMPTSADNVPELRGAFVPPAVRSHPEPFSPVAPSVAVADSNREVDAPSEPERVVSSPGWQNAVAPATAPSANAWNGNPRELWNAFCEGAGVAVDPPQGINPELMRVVGGLLRAAVAGTLQLMTVRATAKHELRAQVTMIQARDNNPLKFSPDARSALEQMLQPPMRGFLAGPAAMTDAMHDLVGHTIGTMAGTRAALEGVLDRFTPQQLEAKLVGRSMLDSLLPMNRKAKLWELYLRHFDTIRDEAHDDFHTLFGRAFLAAYEQQLDRLQREEPGMV
jgi:FHA domain-containing protein